MKVTKKFYVGSRRLQPGWAKETLDEAIEHAKDLCEETGEAQFVVQVVRVVKLEKPITVEEV
jgi:hypothetical protein